MVTTYEWDAEHVDKSGDVLNHNHGDTLQDVRRLADAIDIEDGQRIDIVLVRDVWVEDDLADRTWAYINDDGSLPARFTDSMGTEFANVPKRFHVET